MYNMWSRDLMKILSYEHAFSLSYLEMNEIALNCIDKVVTEEAWKLCVTCNMSLFEAKCIIARALVESFL